MAFSASIALVVPLLLAAGALGSASLWLLRIPRLAILTLLGSLVVGQAWRLPLPGQGGGLLVSDLAVIAVLLAAGFKYLWQRQRVDTVLQPVRWSLYITLPFIGWSLCSLLFNGGWLPFTSLLIAAAYWIRLTPYLLLLPALLLLIPPDIRFVRRSFLTSIVILALLGVVQLWALPNLHILGGGWDPHEERVVSTWLDPNFFGGFLAITLPWVGAVSFKRNQRSTGRQLLGRLSVVLLLGGVLLLTKSRSSLLGLAGGLLLMSPLYVVRWRRQPVTRQVIGISVMSLVILAISLGGWMLRERLVGVLTHDPTVTLRLEAGAVVWWLAAQHWLIGVGYNAYQFAAEQAGLISDFTIHSRAGSDNSLLTLWVTTGVIGVLLWLLPWVTVWRELVRHAWQNHSNEALAVATGLLVWGIHGQFINSWLYGHLLITVVLLCVVTLVPTVPPHD